MNQHDATAMLTLLGRVATAVERIATSLEAVEELERHGVAPTPPRHVPARSRPPLSPAIPPG